ncbi:hypothetical protein [uncultured Rikenella sp.]|uniref:hypothetical protein n=2 Tax=uncultured Rikenella sp. TaxID=368003 RepID=UPI0025D050C8|nr:hypothetical protein [uncultured Rikenella sp.]
MNKIFQGARRADTANKTPCGCAPGYRDFGYTVAAGELAYTGDLGFSWSATASDINGIYLHFGTRAILFSYANSRSHGFQLRCLSEETEADTAAAKRKFRPSTGRGAWPARGQFYPGQSLNRARLLEKEIVQSDLRIEQDFRQRADKEQHQARPRATP